MITLLLLIGFVMLFVNLVRSNLLFAIVLVLFLPVVIPILWRLLSDLWLFFLFLLHQMGVATQ